MGDAVLAWAFPGSRPRTVLPGASTACLGRPHFSSYLMERLGLEVNNSFIGDLQSSASVQNVSTQVRSASEGAAPNFQSLWSAGTRRHEEGTCSICWQHHRYLLNPSRAPCKNGAECAMCHAEHGEQGQ